MIILIAVTVSDLLHQLGRRVQDMLRRSQRGILFSRFPRRAPRGVNAVGFRSGPEIADEFGDGKFAFRRTEAFIGIPSGDRGRERLRIGKPDIFGGKARETAQQIERILAAVEHPRRPVERGIGIRSPQRFVERADQIVMSFAVLVVNRGSALDDLFQSIAVQNGIRGSQVENAFLK